MEEERELIASGEFFMTGVLLLVVVDVTVAVDEERLEAARSEDSSAILWVLGMMVERME